MTKLIVMIVLAVVLFGVVGPVMAANNDKGPMNSLMVSVPNVVGMLGGKGRTAVTDAGLKWAYAPQGIPTGNPNQNAIIASQSPTPGARVQRGSIVTLTLYVFVENKAGDEKGRVNLPAR